MADLKISQLTGATTPLAGTEVLPVVQSSSTKKVSVADLTAGRAVSASSLSLATALTVANGGTGTGTAFTAGSVPFAGASGVYSQNNSRFFWDNTNFRLGIGTATPSTSIHVLTASGEVLVQNTTTAAGLISFRNSNSSVLPLPSIGTVSGDDLQLVAGGATRATFTSTGNITVNTAAKGVNFTANTPAAGMTSQLLNWYEEGTWTPTQGAGLTVVGAFSSTGRYTRIGRQVTVSGTVTGATSVAVTAAGIITTNLPFTVVTAGHGNATNAAVNASVAVICTATNVTSASAIAATGTITFSATYFV